MAIPKKIKDFASAGWFDVYTAEGKIKSIGLHWGEGKKMEAMGFSRKEQIKMLNWLEKNPKIAKKLLL